MGTQAKLPCSPPGCSPACPEGSLSLWPELTCKAALNGAAAMRAARRPLVRKVTEKEHGNRAEMEGHGCPPRPPPPLVPQPSSQAVHRAADHFLWPLSPFLPPRWWGSQTPRGLSGWAEGTAEQWAGVSPGWGGSCGIKGLNSQQRTWGSWGRKGARSSVQPGVTGVLGESGPDPV